MQETQISDVTAYNPAKMFFVLFEDTEIYTGRTLPIFILAQAECEEFDALSALKHVRH